MIAAYLEIGWRLTGVIVFAVSIIAAVIIGPKEKK